MKGVEKKKKKKVKAPPSDAVADGAVAVADGEEATEQPAGQPGKPAKPVDPSAVNVMSGKKYEEEFDLETKRGLVRWVFGVWSWRGWRPTHRGAC